LISSGTKTIDLLTQWFILIEGIKMSLNKLTSAMSIFLFCGSFLLSQSLVDVAKKEKERRERLNGTTSKIVTNRDLKRVPREETPVSVPAQTPPQKSLDITPAQKTPPTRQVENLDQSDRMDTTSFALNHATKVLGSTQFVENAPFALNKPDGQFAEIGEFGFLDLEIEVINREGSDLSIYARRLQEGYQSETMNFGIFVEYRGEWEFIGFGDGNSSPDTFDLGDIRSTNKIRIIFKDFTQDMWSAKPYKLHDSEYSMGIDAVESLHR
jgi:hypothetical protein